MTDGDYVPSYQNVRRVNHLDADSLPDEVLDEHLDRAQTEIENLLKTSFAKTNQPSFSDVTFDTRNLYQGKWGTILYFADFEDYNFIASITSAEYRSTDSGSYDTLTAGMDRDYIVDERLSAIKFSYGLSTDGHNNLKISGTYGYKYTDVPKKFTQLITLVAAIQGVIYASGGSYNNVDSHSIGNVSVSKGQYAPNLRQEYSNLIKEIERHMRTCGIRMERMSPDVI